MGERVEGATGDEPGQLVRPHGCADVVVEDEREADAAEHVLADGRVLHRRRQRGHPVARGHDARSVVGDWQRKSYGEENTFERDVKIGSLELDSAHSEEHTP